MSSYGERVRVSCGATGRYLDYGLALVVSAQDNDLMLDRVADPANPDVQPPHPTLPVPTDDEMRAASAALNYARVTARPTPHLDAVKTDRDRLRAELERTHRELVAAYASVTDDAQFSVRWAAGRIRDRIGALLSEEG